MKIGAPFLVHRELPIPNLVKRIILPGSMHYVYAPISMSVLQTPKTLLPSRSSLQGPAALEILAAISRVEASIFPLLLRPKLTLLQLTVPL